MTASSCGTAWKSYKSFPVYVTRLPFAVTSTISCPQVYFVQVYAQWLVASQVCSFPMPFILSTVASSHRSPLKPIHHLSNPPQLHSRHPPGISLGRPHELVVHDRLDLSAKQHACRVDTDILVGDQGLVAPVWHQSCRVACEACEECFEDAVGEVDCTWG